MSISWNQKPWLGLAPGLGLGLGPGLGKDEGESKARPTRVWLAEEACAASLGFEPCVAYGAGRPLTLTLPGQP